MLGFLGKTTAILCFLSVALFAADAKGELLPEGDWCEFEVSERSQPIEDTFNQDRVGDELFQVFEEVFVSVWSDQCRAYAYFLTTRTLYLVDKSLKKHLGKDLIFKDMGRLKNLIRGLDTQTLYNLRNREIDISKADFVSIFIDVLNDTFVKNIHLFTNDKRFQTPIKWVINGAFTWAKGGIMYAMAGGNKADQAVAGFEFLYGNAEFAYDIFYDVFEAGDQYSNAREDAAMAAARLSMIDLYSKELPIYLKTNPAVAGDSKITRLAIFEADCKEIIRSGFTKFGITNSFDKFQKRDLQLECDRLIAELIDTDRIKTSILILLASEGSREAYDHYAERMFSDEQAIVLKRIFSSVAKSAYFFDTAKSAFVTKYLIAGAALGISIKGDQNGNFNPGKPISHVEALALVSRAFFASSDPAFTRNPDLTKYYQYLLERISLSDTSISSSSLGECNLSGGASNCLSKKDMAKLLVRSSGIPVTRSTVSSSYANAGWDVYSLTLKDNDIVHGHRASTYLSPPRYTVRPQITRAEFLKMLVRTKVHTLCGNEYRFANRPGTSFCTSIEGFLEAQI